MLAALASVGCATLKLPVYPTRALGDYLFVNTADGLRVSLDPVVVAKTSEAYFGTDLLAQGILPVFVQAENTHPNKSFVVSRAYVQLSGGASAVGGTSKENPAAESGKAGEAVAVVSALLVSPIGFVMAGKMISDADVITHNLAVKELQTHTLSPGKAAQGFVYFRVRDGAVAPKTLSFHVTVLDLHTQRQVHIVIAPK
jgi:hypothetical protein